MPFPTTKAALETADYRFLNSKQCPCGATIELWRSPKDAVIPMNPMPAADSPATSHFSDCPMAKQFRRPKK